MPIDLTPISGSAQLPSYQTLAEADALAGEMPPAAVAAYVAGSNGARDAWLKQATADIDAQKWQGSKYDRNQVLEFPRVSDAMSWSRYPGTYFPSYQSVGAEIWDVDTSGVAIVPLKVKLAQIHQANSIAAGRGDSLNAQHDGLSAQAAGPISESYVGTSAGSAAPKLCNEAWELLKRYQLVSGQML